MGKLFDDEEGVVDESMNVNEEFKKKYEYNEWRKLLEKAHIQ